MPVQNFYPAEEYHQRYLEQHPGAYCHVPREVFTAVQSLRVDPELYLRPDDAEIARTLTPRGFFGDAGGETDLPHAHPLTSEVRRGLYVDAVTGKPLFSSADKYQSSCGWPAFSGAVDRSSVVFAADTSHGMRRTEVRGRAGDSHLGHVFAGDPASPSGVRFVPYEEMEREGYGDLMVFVKNVDGGDAKWVMSTQE